MFPPRCMDSVDGDSCVKGQYQTEEPKKETEFHSGAALEKPPGDKSDEKRRDEHQCGDHISLGFGKGVEHQLRIISESVWLATPKVDRLLLKTMPRTNPKGALFYGQLSGAPKMF